MITYFMYFVVARCLIFYIVTSLDGIVHICSLLCIVAVARLLLDGFECRARNFQKVYSCNKLFCPCMTIYSWLSFSRVYLYLKFRLLVVLNRWPALLNSRIYADGISIIWIYLHIKRQNASLYKRTMCYLDKYTFIMR